MPDTGSIGAARAGKEKGLPFWLALTLAAPPDTGAGTTLARGPAVRGPDYTGPRA